MSAFGRGGASAVISDVESKDHLMDDPKRDGTVDDLYGATANHGHTIQDEVYGIRARRGR
jgi:hypothetical protein